MLCFRHLTDVLRALPQEDQDLVCVDGEAALSQPRLLHVQARDLKEASEVLEPLRVGRGREKKLVGLALAAPARAEETARCLSLDLHEGVVEAQEVYEEELPALCQHPRKVQHGELLGVHGLPQPMQRREASHAANAASSVQAPEELDVSGAGLHEVHAALLPGCPGRLPRLLQDLRLHIHADRAPQTGQLPQAPCDGAIAAAHVEQQGPARRAPRRRPEAPHDVCHKRVRLHRGLLAPGSQTASACAGGPSVRNPAGARPCRHAPAEQRAAAGDGAEQAPHV
mmetsp:Transcript_82807/g.267996  ORF Transcript_82807/g.267996 Transcript_82807/m.267996 type:complete len:283 (+) Transcript_82807:330-1178(+)